MRRRVVSRLSASAILDLEACQLRRLPRGPLVQQLSAKPELSSHRAPASSPIQLRSIGRCFFRVCPCGREFHLQPRVNTGWAGSPPRCVLGHLTTGRFSHSSAMSRAGGDDPRRRQGVRSSTLDSPVVSTCGSSSDWVCLTESRSLGKTRIAYRASVQLSHNPSTQVLEGRPSRSLGQGRPFASIPLRVNRAPSAGTSTVHIP